MEVEDDSAELFDGIDGGVFLADFCQEGGEVFPFLGARFAGEGEEVGAVDLVGIGRLGFQAGCEGLGGLDEGGVVEEGEGLLG